MTPIAKNALAGRRILIVEDEYFLADDLKRILDAHSVEVLGPVLTMTEALKAINEA